MTLQERIDELVAQHGSLRAVARVTEIDVGYLSRLRTGEKVNPEKDKLRRLGLRRVVSYERIKTPNAKLTCPPRGAAGVTMSTKTDERQASAGQVKRPVRPLDEPLPLPAQTALGWDYGYTEQQMRRYALLEVKRVEALFDERTTSMRAALSDMLAGWRYIRSMHGDLYGVGWDRAQEKAEKALGLEPGERIPQEWVARDAANADVLRLRALLGECEATLAMWEDVAPALSLRANIRRELGLEA